MTEKTVATAELEIRENQAGLYQATLTETSAKQEGMKNHAASENARRASADDSGEFVANMAENALAPGLQMAGMAVQAVGALNSDPAASKGVKTMESDKAGMYTSSKGNSIRTAPEFSATDKMLNGKLAQVAGTGKAAPKAANSIIAKKSEGMTTDAKAAEGVSNSVAQAKHGMTRSREHHIGLGNAKNDKEMALANQKLENQAAPIAGYKAPALGLDMANGPKFTAPKENGSSSSESGNLA